MKIYAVQAGVLSWGPEHIEIFSQEIVEYEITGETADHYEYKNGNYTTTVKKEWFTRKERPCWFLDKEQAAASLEKNLDWMIDIEKKKLQKLQEMKENKTYKVEGLALGC